MAEQPNIGLLLFIPYRSLENRVIDALVEAGIDDVTPAQMRLAQRIGPGGTRLTELAEAAQVTKQTAGSLVDQLEKAGWVERRPDPTDRRARLICISQRGRQVIPVATAAVEQVEQEWTDYLGTKQMSQLRRILATLQTITDPYL